MPIKPPGPIAPNFVCAVGSLTFLKILLIPPLLPPIDVEGIFPITPPILTSLPGILILGVDELIPTPPTLGNVPITPPGPIDGPVLVWIVGSLTFLNNDPMFGPAMVISLTYYSS